MRTIQISEFNSYDHACLVAKYNSLYKKETIDPKLFEGRSEKEIKYMRKTMGNTLQISCGLEFNKDFKDYPNYPHFNFIIMAYAAYQKSGVLPFPGSLSEQPAQIMEIFETLIHLDQEREEEARRQAQRKSNG